VTAEVDFYMWLPASACALDTGFFTEPQHIFDGNITRVMCRST
jgi:hypothetical protein